MIDRTARRTLSIAISERLSGKMDDLQLAREIDAIDSDDPAVQEVIEFLLCVILDSSFTDSDRRTAERCARFLRTDTEYSWPRYDVHDGAWPFLWFAVSALGSLLLSQIDYWISSGLFLLAGLLGFAALQFRVRRRHLAILRHARSVGDLSAWPFGRRH